MDVDPSLWRQSERREHDRRSPDRQDPGRRQLQRRREERRTMPMAAGSITSVVTVPGGGSYAGLLWDVSHYGLCVLNRGVFAAQEGELLSVTLRPDFGVQELTLAVRIRWFEAVDKQLFLGLELLDAPLPANTFLEEYLTTHWTDG